jgi:hypothetical protein
MLHEYHVIYSFPYYPRLHVAAVGLGNVLPVDTGHYCISISSRNMFTGCLTSQTRTTLSNNVKTTSGFYVERIVHLE